MINKRTKGLKACFEQSRAWQTWCLVTVAKAEPIPGCKGSQMVGFQLTGNWDKKPLQSPSPSFLVIRGRERFLKYPSGAKKFKSFIEVWAFYEVPLHLEEPICWSCSPGVKHLPRVWLQPQIPTWTPQDELFHPCFPAEAKLLLPKVTSKGKGSAKCAWTRRSHLLNKANVLTLQLMRWWGLYLL